jgi:hypothetical protein
MTVRISKPEIGRTARFARVLCRPGTYVEGARQDDPGLIEVVVAGVPIVLPAGPHVRRAA